MLLPALSTACAPRVRTDVAVFHSLPDGDRARTYAFMPLQDQDAAFTSLEYRTGIRDELRRHGFREEAADDAALIVAFSHSMDTDRGQDGAAASGAEQEYTRRLWVYIMDRDSLTDGQMHVLYEGNVIAHGPPGLLSVAMPAMIRELFREFPGRSGTVRTEHINVN